jgi:L-2-hydroxyglutarate oxidase LhgO
VDSHALMLALLGDIENAGGVLALNSAVDHVHIAQSAIELIASDGTRLLADTVVNAAGHGATVLAAKMTGLPAQCIPRSYYAKGSYFSLAGRSPFSHLIYPVPEAAGLGVHLTLDMGGQARFGPDVEWVESPDDLEVDPARGEVFYAEVRKYWPQLPDAALIPAYAGVRPKICGPDDEASDFCIQGPEQHGIPGLVNLFGIESPGLTSAMAIGQYVAAMCVQG